MRVPGALGWLILADRPLGWHRWPWWRWWRRHVHPWTDQPRVRDAFYPMPGQAAGGPVPIVAGVTFVSERESGAWISCVPCAATMVLGWAEREPSPHLNDAHRIREGAGLPHSGGMTDAQLADGLEAEYGVQGTTIPATKAAVLEALDEGRGLTWFHTYGRLPENLRRWSPSFTGGHCAAIIGRKSPTSDLVGWWDPLATSDWTGEWVDIDTLLGADWGDPARSFQRPQEEETVEPVPVADATPGMTVDLPKLWDLYAYPGQAPDSQVPTAQPGAPVLFVTGTGWTAVSFRGQAMYVKGLEVIPAPPPSGGGGGGSYEEGYQEGVADQWQAWADGLGVPPPPPPAE